MPETQYVYLNDSVTFECATNLTGYTCFFFYGTDVKEVETNLPNGGKKTIFTATSQVNGTYIFCVARKGSVTNSTDLAYIYIQGKTYLHKIIKLYNHSRCA